MRWLTLLSLVVFTGCRFGGGGFEGDLDGQVFDPVGTVFTWVDARDADLVAREAPRVIVVATWLVFDGAGDVALREGAELEDMRHEATLRDNLALVFPSAPSAGDVVESVVSGGREEGALSARVYLQPEVLDQSSTFSGFVPFASTRTVGVEVEAADLAGAGLRASVNLSLERGEADPEEVREGQVSGELIAPVVDERLAEHNLAVLGLDALLGLD